MYLYIVKNIKEALLAPLGPSINMCVCMQEWMERDDKYTA